ncbi:inner membrane protein YiaA [Marinomonas lutimaris]|uniref:inner membrane protein YiaA n=1 Tax=Marinomonas lutimaris TaxID=2846746 RepID=UPI001CA481EC|nr:inner membrane protein YiaA [Marinomonas lutimaris]
MNSAEQKINQPTTAYIFATWAAMAIGVLGYLIGLWNAALEFNEKGYYLAVFLLSMFAAVTLQKTVRDKEEGIPVTGIFSSICWVAFLAGIVLLIVGLFNAQMQLSEKGFYCMAFALSLFAVITTQKNIRDLASVPNKENMSFSTSSQKSESAQKADNSLSAE